MTTETSDPATGVEETTEREPATDGAKPAGGRKRRLRADELAALEEQRDFLLRSLDDLEREHAAGDVDEDDYVALRDDYTARAARVIRTIEAHTVRVRAKGAKAEWWRRPAVIAGVVAFAVLAGVLVQQSAGRREAGDTMTGDVSETNQGRLDEAFVLASQGRYDEAIDLQDEVLDDDPYNVEAMAYKGWFNVLSGDVGRGMDSLTQAVEIDPDYPDTHAFLAILLERAGRPDYALRELDRLAELDPPPEMTALTSQLRARLESSTTTTTPPPPAP
jgi:tetratricopeptide (TPR) repeat protein